MSTQRFDPHYVERGARVGAYVIRDHVATGGSGCLYRVERDGRTYAMKIGFQRLGGLDAEDRRHLQDRLDREIAALKSCRHPNIVRVHSFDCWPELEDGFPYLVMDFVEGKELYEWRSEGSPSLGRISLVFEKIAAAIDYMHGIGIFHRDLKSENVLVRSDGEPVIVDFGIARAQTAHTVTRCASVGTATHFAPEYARYCDSAAFLRGEPFEWKATADLHAIGYMLYETLTGRPPFPRGKGSEPVTEAAVLLAIKNTIPKKPSE